MSVRVLQPGLLTSIQDHGRWGFQRFGVVVGGAMDLLALRLANLLVANAQPEAVLEITLTGPSLEFETDALIAICGANMSPSIDGQAIGLGRPVWVRGGAILRFGTLVNGCRAYLAVGGGFDVPLVMGSRGTYLQAQIGGFEGRALKTGDVLNFGSPSPQAAGRAARLSQLASGTSLRAASWFLDPDLPGYCDNPTVRVLIGAEFDWLTAESQAEFFAGEFALASQSDRVGYRLAGPALKLATPRELISRAVTMGTIQLPAGGEPIVLMADRPTTGGYAKIAQVAAVDLPLLAQLKTGATVRFQPITLAAAEELYRQREAAIEKLAVGIGLRNEA